MKRILLTALLLTLLVGCGTVQGRKGSALCHDDRPMWDQAFPALNYDGIKVQNERTNYVADMPLSLVTDLILLPYDLTYCSLRDYTVTNRNN